MDTKGRLWFPWLHFLSYLGWLEGWWVPFLRGGKQGNGQRRMCVDQRGPREGVRAGSHPGENAGTAAAGGEQECRIPPASGTAMQELP